MVLEQEVLCRYCGQSIAPDSASATDPAGTLDSSSRRKSNLGSMLVLGGAIAVVAIVAIVMAQRGDGERSGDVSVFDLRVGDCFDGPEDFSTSVETVRAVPCAEAHDNEIYHAFDVPDGPYPGEADLDASADQECVGAFESFVGRDYLESVLEFFPITPTSSSWAAGDRTVSCALHARDLSKLTGTMRGSQR